MTGEIAGLAWQPHPRVRAFSSFRAPGGHSPPPFDRLNLGINSGDDPALVQANRRLLQEALQLPRPPRWLRQVHGTAVVRFDTMHPGGPEPTADAAVSSVPGVALAILTADCLPVLLCDDAGTEVGAAHAGWRGLARGVLEATVAAMHAPAERLQAWMGPCAGPGAYEVGAEVYDSFVQVDSSAAGAFRATRSGHWLVDLPGLARRRLAAAGVQRIFGGDECTISDPARWYSYRRDGATGRMASLIWINEDPGQPAQG